MKRIITLALFITCLSSHGDSTMRNAFASAPYTDSLRIPAFKVVIEKYKDIPKEQLSTVARLRLSCSDEELGILREYLGKERSHLISNSMKILSDKELGLIDAETGIRAFSYSIIEIRIEDQKAYVAMFFLYGNVGGFTRAYVFEYKGDEWIYTETVDPEDVGLPNMLS